MKLLTVKEVAEMLNASPKTIYQWVKTNRIPYTLLPGQNIRFNQAQIESWLKQRTISTNIAGVKI